jgi:hypothetical protein
MPELARVPQDAIGAEDAVATGSLRLARCSTSCPPRLPLLFLALLALPRPADHRTLLVAARVLALQAWSRAAVALLSFRHLKPLTLIDLSTRLSLCSLYS